MEKFVTNLILREPTIIDEEMVMDLRTEFYNTNCKFNGTCDLDLFASYIDWLAYTLQHCKYNFSLAKDHTGHVFLAIKSNLLIGMVEIIEYIDLTNMKRKAHIIECVRPSQRRKGYGKLLVKKAIEECRSWGIKREFVTYEMNSKASTGKMNQITDF